MNEYKKNVGKLIVYWTPKDDTTSYIFSLSYLTDFFVRNRVLNRQNPEFPISYIPENNPAGKYDGRLFINLSDNSLNISLIKPEVIEEKLYPTGKPVKPTKIKKDYIMNLEKLNYKQLFPYIYIKPWPNATKNDIENNFAECCCEVPLNFSQDFTSCKNKNNPFYNELTRLKSEGDRLGMENQSVFYINGYDDNKEPVYINQYKPDLSSLTPLYKNIFKFGQDLRAKEKVTFTELTSEVNKYFDSWENLKNDLEEPENKSEQVKIAMSYIALVITFGYDFEWMTNLQQIIITISLLYKALQYVETKETNSADEEKISEGDPIAPTPETIHAWINATVILPDDVFPLPSIKEENEKVESTSTVEWVKPYSLGKLKMIKYMLRKYELGEVSKIESVLKGEIKTVKERKLNKIEHEAEFRKEDIITWEEALDESFFGSVSSLDKTLKQRTGITTYNDDDSGSAIGGWTVDENPAGGKQTEENAFAKKVINEAAEIITQKVNYSRTSKHLHEHEEKVIHQFNNLNSEKDIIGVYRWINKIYKFRSIEYGNRVMLQIYCSNPAEYYLKNEFQFHHLKSKYQPGKLHIEKVKTPEQLGVNTFVDISESRTQEEEADTYYLNLLEYYEISHFPSPPESNYYADKNIQGILKEEKTSIFVPLYYNPVNVKIDATLTDKVAQLAVLVGKQEKIFTNSDSVELDLSSADLNINQLPILISAELDESNDENSNSPENIDFLYTVNFQITASIKENVLNEWKYKINILLQKGYKKKLNEYYELVKHRSRTIASSNARLNKDIVLQQLKNKCTDVLKNHYTRIINGGAIDPNESDKTDVQNLVTGEPTFLQFIERGIEWDKLTYRFYPEFENPALYSNNTIEQNFKSFLRSKFARILVPIKNDCQFSFLFSLSTGWLWPGNDTDSPAVLNNVNLFNQIKNMEWIQEDSEKESWEVSVPTSLTMLQKDSELPEFNGG